MVNEVESDHESAIAQPPTAQPATADSASASAEFRYARPPSSATPSRPPGIEREYLMRSEAILHSLPIAQLITLMRQEKVNGYIRHTNTHSSYMPIVSLSALLKLQVRGGDSIRIVIDGDRAEKIHKRVAAIIISA